jgi:hypothetical protein
MGTSCLCERMYAGSTMLAVLAEADISVGMMKGCYPPRP